MLLHTSSTDTSSFFKVSLKTNNKALALALEAQKERSRQLENGIVYYQRQVEDLCFELAAKKYKHRKLVGLFAQNDLQLQQFTSRPVWQKATISYLASIDYDAQTVSEVFCLIGWLIVLTAVYLVSLSQLLILKTLHSNTLQHLDMVADLFSDSVRIPLRKY